MEGLEPHAVGNYIKNYKLSGLSGLEMKHSTAQELKENLILSKNLKYLKSL
jgi:hypothetical protein